MAMKKKYDSGLMSSGSRAEKPKVQRWTFGFRQSERSHKVIILLLRPKTGWNRLATLNSAFH